MYLFTVTDNTDLIRIPGMGSNIMIVVAPEMLVIEEQAFYRMIRQQLFAASPDDGQISLVYHFVALQVEEPVAFAGFLGDIGLVRMFHSPGIFVKIPDGMNDPYFVGPDALYLVQGPVIFIAVSKGYDEFIHERKNGSNRLFDGVIKLGSISYHGKSADGHVVRFILHNTYAKPVLSIILTD
jgi:hypothetical protein